MDILSAHGRSESMEKSFATFALEFNHGNQLLGLGGDGRRALPICSSAGTGNLGAWIGRRARSSSRRRRSAAKPDSPMSWEAESTLGALTTGLLSASPATCSARAFSARTNQPEVFRRHRLQVLALGAFLAMPAIFEPAFNPSSSFCARRPSCRSPIPRKAAPRLNPSPASPQSRSIRRA